MLTATVMSTTEASTVVNGPLSNPPFYPAESKATPASACRAAVPAVINTRTRGLDSPNAPLQDCGGAPVRPPTFLPLLIRVYRLAVWLLDAVTLFRNGAPALCAFLSSPVPRSGNIHFASCSTCTPAEASVRFDPVARAVPCIRTTVCWDQTQGHPSALP